MDDEYINNGYELMTTYITEQRIKTRNRKFLRKLDKFYENYSMKDEPLTVEEEQEYINLEREFFTNILPEPEDTEDKAAVEFLKIISQADL